MADEGFEDAGIKGSMYKCPSCGGFLRYDPESNKLKCEHCSSTVDLDIVGSAKELPYNSNSEVGYSQWGNKKTYKCRSCGATTVLDDFQTATVCPFCQAPNIMPLDQLPGLRPNAILPFKISEPKAHDTYAAWIRSKKIAPNDLKRKAEKQSINGIYIPVFTFDTNMYTTYNIRYGVNYTVTVGSGKNKHTEVRTRWYEKSGSQSEFYNDIQIEASAQIMQKDLNGMGGFDTDNCVNYHEQFVTGYAAERYSTGLDDSWNNAKSIAESSMRQTILSQYHYDVLDYIRMKNTYSGTTYKYTLLPLWSIAYKYNKKDYRCHINGRSGKAAGTYPKSPYKIAAIVCACLVVVGLVVFGLKYFGVI